ncbi:MAG: putative metal-binding motif-containing protein, partial [Deltaproteobacteria bacterium]|nr:putative metal-binding motif-containing protein [Deltaproteobacteria bacterium]
MFRATVESQFDRSGKRSRAKQVLDAFRLVLMVLGLGALLVAAAPTAALAGVPACPDGDSDGYVVCNGCDSTSKLCGECNDGDAAISPGDPELCGTGVDENCAGGIDEGFDVGAACGVDTTNAFGTCTTAGLKECSGNKLTTVCVALGPLDVPEQEGVTAAHASCFDQDDNDCDGLEDHQEAA